MNRSPAGGALPSLTPGHSITREFRLGRLSPPARALLRALAAADRRAQPVLVGGAVRDGLLGRVVADVDVAVERGALALARAVADRVGGAFVALDDERGTARVIAGRHRLDVADFRADTLAGDLRARDFTVNALAVPVRELLRRGRARVVDPCRGLDDLRARRLRLPSPDVLTDDPARMLRGARLEAQLGFTLAPATVRAIRVAADDLRSVSAERVRDELVALLAQPASARAVRRLDALGVLRIVLPEVEPMRATGQPAPHRFGVLEHSLRALAGADQVLAHLPALAPFGEELAPHLAQEIAGGIDRGVALKLAVLLHDVAKPETVRLVEGRVRFFGHDLIGAERARGIGRRLRLPDRVIGVVERLVRHHLRPMHLGQSGELTRRARYRFYRDLGEDARDLLLLTLADAAAVTGESPLALWRRATLIRDLLGGWQDEQGRAAAPPLVRGEDVMRRFGLPPGPEVGRLLARAREAQALGLVTTAEQTLAFLDSPGDEPLE